MPHDFLRALIGSPQLLTAREAVSEEAHAVQLIGYLPEHSIIVTAPRREGVPVFVDTGDEFTATFEQGEADVAFDTTMLRAFSQPYPHLYLSYPQGFQSSALRRGHRVNADLPNLRLIMAGGNRPVATSLIDISICGGRIVAKEEIGDVNDRFAIELAIGPNERAIRLSCIIRYILIRGDGSDREYHHGVTFTDLDSSACSFLQNHIRNAISISRASRRDPPAATASSGGLGSWAAC